MPAPKTLTSIEEVRTLVTAMEPFIWVTTYEEQRFLEDLETCIAKPARIPIFTWSQHQGIKLAYPTDPEHKLLNVPPELVDANSTKQITAALQAIEDCNVKDMEVNGLKVTQAIFILKDLHSVLAGKVPRQLRDIIPYFSKAGKTILVAAPSLAYGPQGATQGAEPTLEKSMSIVNFSLPTREQIEDIIRQNVATSAAFWDAMIAAGKTKKSKSPLKTTYTDDEYYEFSRALQGLTAGEAETAVSISMAAHKEIIPERLRQEKRQQLKKSDILEYIEPTAGLKEVGGLDNLKKFIIRYKACHSKEAEAYGAEPLRGLIFVGVPGCLHGDTIINDPVDGSSLTVKERYRQGKFFSVTARNQNKSVIATAYPPKKYPAEEMLKFHFENGTNITVTKGHQFWDGEKYVSASEVFLLLQGSEPVLLPTTSDIYQPAHQQDASRSMSTVLDYQSDYHLDSHSYDGQSQLEASKDNIPRYTRVVKCESAGKDNYFDFHVPIHNNYAAAGLWHHNCGKSLASKAIGTEWGNPTIRLDIGRVMAGLVGASENNMRMAINLASSCAPCNLWVDEIEKGLSGTKSSGQTDGGTMSRVFGTLLTAMQEGMKGVTLIMTANDISALPPEFIRRVDEVFFVDLPGPDERKEIFSIHLDKKKRDPANFDLDLLSKHANNLTGDEIRKAVKEGIIHAFSEKAEQVTNDHILTAISDTKPLFTLMKESIEKTREWAKGRARYASSYAEMINAPGHQTVGAQELSVDDACGDLEEVIVKKNKRTVESSTNDRLAAVMNSAMMQEDNNNTDDSVN